MKSNQIFANLGHGIGNTVIQAAATIKCEARGIELDEGRFKLSLKFRDHMCALMKIKASTLEGRLMFFHIAVLHATAQIKKLLLFCLSLQNMSFGRLYFSHGSFCDSKFFDYLAEADVIFVNNAKEIFAARSQNKENDPYLDFYVAKIFASQKPGSKMATLHQLPLGPRLTEANHRRRKKGKKHNQNASFYDVEKHILARYSVSWTSSLLHVYIYTRTQNTYKSHTPFSVCENCDHAFSVLSKNCDYLIDTCPACNVKRPTAGGTTVTIEKNKKCM